jgi:hypothetical protein
MPITYTSIESKTISSLTTSFSFTSIPQTYTDLILSMSGLSVASETYIKFNDDSTSANYSAHTMSGQGNNAGYPGVWYPYRYNGSSNGIIIGNRGTTSSTTIPTYYYVNIMSYTNGNIYKNTLSRSGIINNSTSGSLTGNVEITTGMWKSTAAINKITVLNSAGGNFQVGTTATLYGVKNS